jgi:hypothetical protein
VLGEPSHTTGKHKDRHLSYGDFGENGSSGGKKFSGGVISISRYNLV